ncbi:hypothetical protein G7012_08825 [Pseudomonas psychrotolerans]|nr:hypothetical protein [Pseudomonas psychrotolerans]
MAYHYLLITDEAEDNGREERFPVIAMPPLAEAIALLYSHGVPKVIEIAPVPEKLAAITLILLYVVEVIPLLR